MNHFKTKQLYWIIFAIILVNSFGLFWPLIRNDDPTLYASIAKNMILNHDFMDLTYHGSPWLDKPHFPFWVVALSFSILGVNSFAYLLPGFLFSLLGGFYTYKLAKELYNKDIGLISAIIYLSSFHILISSIDVRAEAYLLGTIMPACYYWYRYYKLNAIKWLLLGAIFTALAIMTKGIFVLVTIMSGLISIWLIKREYNNFVHYKWLIAIGLSFLFITPEILALYLQFDIHANNPIVHGVRVSGLKWFFWDSQFGRFFNHGPIVQTNPMPWHYLFFIHTFLWSFLPWCTIFVVAIIDYFKGSKTIDREDRLKDNYLWGSFLPTFILFSLSRFQLDYYIDIIIPFASIICATWFFKHRLHNKGMVHKIFYLQIWLSVILTSTVVLLSLFIFGHNHTLIMSIFGVGVLTLFIVFIHQDDLAKAILYPIMSISLLFIFIMLINGRICTKYDAGYQAARYLNQEHLKVIDYDVNSVSLEFHSKNPYQTVGNNITKLQDIKEAYYIFLKKTDLVKIERALVGRKVSVVDTVNGTSVNIVFRYLFSRPMLNESLSHYLIVKVDAHE